MKPKQANKNNKKQIDKIECIIIAFFIIFGLVWVWWLLPVLQYSGFYQGLNPVGAYLVYNIGFITIFTATFGVPIGYFIKGDINIPDMLRGGFSSFLGFSFIADLWSTPLAWTPSGILAIIPTADNMETTSVDYMVGWIFQSLGIHGSLLYFAVYGLVPVIAVFLMALLLKPKELLKVIEGK